MIAVVRYPGGSFLLRSACATQEEPRHAIRSVTARSGAQRDLPDRPHLSTPPYADRVPRTAAFVGPHAKPALAVRDRPASSTTPNGTAAPRRSRPHGAAFRSASTTQRTAFWRNTDRTPHSLVRSHGHATRALRSGQKTRAVGDRHVAQTCGQAWVARSHAHAARSGTSVAARNRWAITWPASAAKRVK